MDRRAEITRFIQCDSTGIEIAPWFNPLAPKREGYQCLTLDVADTETLRARAKLDPWIPDDLIPCIESVDLVGNAGDLAELVPSQRLGTFDYVLSSHNFEHLPNPVAFLRACEKVLKPGGILSMAIPDRRVCFDYFRPHTILTEWLEAFFEDRKAPSAAQIFTENAYRSEYRSDGQNLGSFALHMDPGQVVPMETLQTAYEDWNNERHTPRDDYQDTHCSAMTPASMECLIRDLNYLGLIKLLPLEVSATHGNEFYVHLKNAAPDSPPPDHQCFYDNRRELLHRINDEASANSRRGFGRTPVVEPPLAERIDELERQLASFKASRSWKFTAPFRFVSGLVRSTARIQQSLAHRRR